MCDGRFEQPESPQQDDDYKQVTDNDEEEGLDVQHVLQQHLLGVRQRGQALRGTEKAVRREQGQIARARTQHQACIRSAGFHEPNKAPFRPAFTTGRGLLLTSFCISRRRMKFTETTEIMSW